MKRDPWPFDTTAEYRRFLIAVLAFSAGAVLAFAIALYLILSHVVGKC